MSKNKTKFGSLHGSVGFSKTDGPITPLETQLDAMEKSGHTVQRTDKGIIIAAPVGSVHGKLNQAYR